MIVITWLCPWYATEAVEIYTDRPSCETKHPKRYKAWKILSPDTASQMENSVSGLRQSPAQRGTKDTEWMASRQCELARTPVSSVLLIHFNCTYVCLHTSMQVPVEGSRGLWIPQSWSYRGLWTSWGHWELTPWVSLQEQQVLLTSTTSHWSSFKLGCHPQAVSFVWMAIF